MSKTIFRFTAIAALCGAAATVQANEISWDYADIGYVTYDGSDGPSGVGIELGSNLGENGYVSADGRYLRTERMRDGDRADIVDIELAAGVRGSVAARTDLYGGVSLVNLRANYDSGFSINDTGPGVHAGVRHTFGAGLEFGARYSVTKVFDEGTRALEIDALFDLNNRWSLLSQYTFSNGYNEGFKLGVRYNFG